MNLVDGVDKLLLVNLKHVQQLLSQNLLPQNLLLLPQNLLLLPQNLLLMLPQNLLQDFYK
jgi:hypothetical protein